MPRAVLVRQNVPHRYVHGIARFIRGAVNWSILPVHENSTRLGAGGLARSLASAAVLDVSSADDPSLDAAEIPVVNILQNGYLHRLPTVCVDNYAVGRMGFDHLRTLGLTRFAFLPFESAADNLPRQEGFLDAAKAAGMADRVVVLPNRLTTANRQISLVQQARIFRRLPRPLGMMCFSDWLANHALSALHLARIAVPGEIAVLGVDDDDAICDATQPPLSSIDTAQERVGFEAARLAIRLADGAAPPREPVLIPPVGVIERLSTQVMASDDEDVTTALRLITQHEADQTRVTVERICDEVLVPRRTLDAKFTRELGHTVADELRRRRLHKALSLLEHTELSMAEVADRAGFETVSHMGRLVREHTGRPAAAYRKWVRP